ncbi:right-handed parallel beta-helix repeat-containing protein [Bacillus sp. 1NLA3E]|uniref:right-handed parallel beta-helix repeat-containing protein n=1 Tax=Bacillus sp. 1NLA3E TaxID=666686 RepID=UPI000247EF82|nr:NosD domain-containing protein [Bacillus sp. 1NLA3E]
MLPKRRIIWFFLFVFLLSGNSTVQAKMSVQDLIDQAKDGGTVEIPSGTYKESININKPVTVIGAENVTIISDGKTPAIKIKNKGASVKNIRIENKSAETAIFISGSNHLINNVTIKTAGYGIQLNEANKIEIDGVKISGTTDEKHGQQNGIDLFRSKDNLIKNNSITTVKDGIYVDTSTGNTITGNKVSYSRYGLHFMFTQGNTVKGNTFSQNLTGSMIMGSHNEVYSENYLLKNRQNVNSQGLYLYDVQDTMIQNNYIRDNRIGIMIDNSFTNSILHNDVQGNAIGIIFKQSTKNRITRNDFQINVITILTYGGDSKNNKLYENYWDSQMGLDGNGDGFSDLAVVADPYFMRIMDKNSAYQLLFQSPGMVIMEKLFKGNEGSLVKDQSPAMIPNIQEDRQIDFNRGIMLISILFILSSFIIYFWGRKKL